MYPSMTSGLVEGHLPKHGLAFSTQLDILVRSAMLNIFMSYWL